MKRTNFCYWFISLQRLHCCYKTAAVLAHYWHATVHLTMHTHTALNSWSQIMRQRISLLAVSSTPIRSSWSATSSYWMFNKTYTHFCSAFYWLTKAFCSAITQISKNQKVKTNKHLCSKYNHKQSCCWTVKILLRIRIKLTHYRKTSHMIKKTINLQSINLKKTYFIFTVS